MRIKQIVILFESDRNEGKKAGIGQDIRFSKKELRESSQAPEENKLGDVSKEIFGDEIFQTDEISSEESSTDESAVESIKPSQNYDGESLSGAKKTLEKQSKINSSSPEIASSDIDALWQDPSDGSEHSLGPNPTPDQDQIEEVSKPWGEDYKSEETLDILHKNRRIEGDRDKDEESKST